MLYALVPLRKCFGIDIPLGFRAILQFTPMAPELIGYRAEARERLRLALKILIKGEWI